MKSKLLLIITFTIMTVTAHAGKTDINTVKQVGFDADYFPAATTEKYGVILLSGSGGGKAIEMAKRIANMGYSVLSLAYFYEDIQKNNLPTTLEMIPLEYFDAPKNWLKGRPETRNDGVIVLGISKGAELSLVLATQDPEYKAVVAVAPSSVIWAGISSDTSSEASKVSSWSHNGKGLPFVPLELKSRNNLKKAGLYKFADMYTTSIGVASNIDQALIKVEKIKAPTLLISASNDFVWPANAMASAICRKMNTEQQDLCKHVNFEHGSHAMGMDKVFIKNEKLTGNIADVTSEISRFLRTVSL